MTRTVIVCKQQTLTANRLADRVCCLHAAADRSLRTSAFVDARAMGDMSVYSRVVIYTGHE